MIDRTKELIINIRLIVIVAVFASLITGCKSFYQNAGSRTRVGNLSTPIEFSAPSDSFTIKAMFDMNGADVYTAKDTTVWVSYENSYTNSYFGIIERTGVQALEVELTPSENCITNENPVLTGDAK